MQLQLPKASLPAPPPITVVEELEDELCLLGGTSDHVGSYVVSRSTAALIGVHESVSQTTSCQLFPGPLWAVGPKLFLLHPTMMEVFFISVCGEHYEEIEARGTPAHKGWTERNTGERNS